LPSYEKKLGVVALKLKPEVAAIFRSFHNITIENGKVIFPEI
jgi:hypothetical protein